MTRNQTYNITNPFPFTRLRVFSFFIGLFLTVHIGAQDFEFSNDLKNAYELVIKLELTKGQALVDKIKINEPNNYLVYHVENYIDFFRCFIDEDEKYFKKIKDNKDFRLDKISNGNEKSPYYKFSQAEILLQWALMRLKFEEYPTALYEINSAIKLLEENEKLFPDFIENKKSLSALHAIVGTIPEKYRNILSWVSSFNGTIEQGYREINEVYSQLNKIKSPFAQEVIVIKSLIELHLKNDSKSAYSTIQSPYLNPTNNPLICFISANVTHRFGKNDAAIDILLSHKPTNTQHPLYYLEYLKGIYKLNRLDKDSDQYIRKYLNYFNGRNYIKEAYQKLAWYEWVINKDSLEYKRNMSYCILKGNDQIDEDKQAFELAKNKTIPNRDLLQVRLLSDGSYLNKAKEFLSSIESNKRSVSENIEFYYRQGRIAQGLNNHSLTEKAYLSCLSLPYDKSLYFQLASSLYLGKSYEDQKNFAKAKTYYSNCLQMDSAQYKTSLQQKAKAGLQRVN